MKTLRRIIFWFLCVLMVAPIVIVGADLFLVHPGKAIPSLAAIALPAQAVAAIVMLIWCVIYLKVEPTLCRAGILLAVLAIVLLGLTTAID